MSRDEPIDISSDESDGPPVPRLRLVRSFGSSPLLKQATVEAEVILGGDTPNLSLEESQALSESDSIAVEIDSALSSDEEDFPSPQIEQIFRHVGPSFALLPVPEEETDSPPAPQKALGWMPFRVKVAVDEAIMGPRFASIMTHMSTTAIIDKRGLPRQRKRDWIQNDSPIAVLKDTQQAVDDLLRQCPDENQRKRLRINAGAIEQSLRLRRA